MVTSVVEGLPKCGAHQIRLVWLLLNSDDIVGRFVGDLVAIESKSIYFGNVLLLNTKLPRSSLCWWGNWSRLGNTPYGCNTPSQGGDQFKRQLRSGKRKALVIMLVQWIVLCFGVLIELYYFANCGIFIVP